MCGQPCAGVVVNAAGDELSCVTAAGATAADAAELGNGGEADDDITGFGSVAGTRRGWSTFPAKHAVDGDANTAWARSGGDCTFEWAVAPGAVAEISRITVLPVGMRNRPL